MVKVLIIVPAYNEEEAIASTVADIHTHFPQGDVLVINDCSQDNTLAVLRREGIPHLNLPLNLGIGGGVQAGYQYALANDYDIAVQFDGDGQHRADQLEALIAPLLADEADMVVGSRFVAGEGQTGFQSSAMRRMGISFLSGLIRMVTRKQVKDVTSGFRACNRPLIQLFALAYAQDYPEPEAIITVIAHGYRIKEVSSLMRERKGGVSSIQSLKTVHYMVKVSLAVLVMGIRSRNRKWRKRHV